MRSLGRLTARPDLPSAVGSSAGLTTLRAATSVAAAAVLSLGVLVAPAPSGAAAPSAVTASAVVPGTVGGYSSTRRLVVMPGGRAAVTLTSAGLTKFAVSPRAIKRLGTVRVSRAERAGVDDFVAVGHVVYVRESNRIQLYDVSGRTPRKARAVTAKALFPGQTGPEVTDVVLDARSHRLYVTSRGVIRALEVQHPSRPRLGPMSRLPAGMFGDSVKLAVTPSSSALVAVGDHVTPGCGKYDCREAQVAVFAISSGRASALVRSTTLMAPWWPSEWSSHGLDVLMSPSGRSVYVEVRTWGEMEVGASVQAVAGVRLSDLATHWLPPGPRRVPHLRDVSADGTRVYSTIAYPEDEGYTPAGALAWADGGLAAQHAGPGLGNVRDVRVSRAGSTKGLVYVLSTSSGTVRLRSVHLR